MIRDEARRALVNYVYETLGLSPEFRSSFDLSAYYPISNSSSRSKPLFQVLTLLGDPSKQVVQPPVVLESPATYVKRNSTSGDVPDPSGLLARWKHVDPADHFDVWTQVIRLAASGLSARNGEPGVSLFHEFKAISAIVHATLASPPEQAGYFTLVSGDFPGIQNAIYTVSSDGATKSVRGRSFFLQLLADCVVHRLLEFGDLPSVNALMVAGGNFLLLLPAGYEAAVADETVEISRNLLDVFSGDLAMIAESLSVSIDDLLDKQRFGTAHRELKLREARAKKQPFRSMALSNDEGWERVFGVSGIGGEHACLVCQREPEPEEYVNAAASGPEWLCDECAAFADLASDLAKTTDPYLVFEKSTPHGERQPSYAQRLQTITNWACRIHKGPPLLVGEQGTALRLNAFQLKPNPAGDYGTRLFAAHTPLVTWEDVKWIEERYQNEALEDEWSQVGTIRTFEMLGARRTAGLERLGVLRMDVDNLGALFRDRLGARSVAKLLAVSDALSIFFDGYLATLCAAFESECSRPDSLYLLYGGGDDLFIVGEWDLLPYLAQRIRDEFSRYTSGELSISAGIVLVPLKFPFYRSAELAESALDDGAKAFRDEKDAINFLDVSLPWKHDEAWQVVVEEHSRLKEIVAGTGKSSILQNVLTVFNRWQHDVLVRGKSHIQYGPYIWLAAYQMSKLAKQYPAAKADIEHIQTTLLQPSAIRWSGPAARWAELEQRAHQEKERA
ncbi:type III-A CRISPR-associated protein Cas10/Csm1 [Aggregatilinea lenta]|uniref:type III-A CRISPR-associated protein Cas10/Csm1 n=1 Tax=Aggregatilinea lenta TaxID=913108 RepID=UPI0013C2D635|nr:type III-A CRISPR-associated protein Cas10/Csm1 [Aggregatilinea lenta]